ncbi:Tab2/Atab2 family RNA-binding protein [Oscillatoria sp. CS-180]|uniref:Tab2/Atab2 family RNA-binding protein n=1 Tax=Oscillatoria sp. CS-180 TaxID=3021720 RepID=UPI00232BB034|nr:Tab2/Atab2 family RNA-binding protein [Oscillatoria sp. CS-180]MDB9526129.1 Tab2/Atab2 family RNA-binding protein [Oscillatoria sp. CS-180]
MTIWEADCYRRPLQDDAQNPLWELLICDSDFQFTYGAIAPQHEVNSPWLQQQLKTALQKSQQTPEEIRVFRPQSVSLVQAAAQSLDIAVKPMRHTPVLKQWLVQRASWYKNQSTYSGEPYTPIELDRPAPTPIPENLWGEQWRFGSLSAQDFQENLIHEPIPVQAVPTEWLPLKAGLASTAPVPGVIIDAGRRAMLLCQWLQEQQPASLNYIPGAPDGVILEAGLVDRWVLTTFEDEQVKVAGQGFSDRQQQANGLHFLLVRPDDSGITFTGLWLLKKTM